MLQLMLMLMLWRLLLPLSKLGSQCIYIYLQCLCVFPGWADFPGEKSHGQLAMSSSSSPWQIERVTKVKCSEK